MTKRVEGASGEVKKILEKLYLDYTLKSDEELNNWIQQELIPKLAEIKARYVEAIKLFLS